MLPSALPAFSPPSGVSSAPSRAASSGLTAARSSAGASSSTAAVKRISVFIAAPPLFACPRASAASERELDAGCNEAAIVEQVVLARTPVVGVRDVQIPPVADAGRESHGARVPAARSEEHTSELQSLRHLVCRLLLEKKKKKIKSDDM